MAITCAECGDEINKRVYLLKGVGCSGAGGGCTVVVHRFHVRELCRKKKWFGRKKSFAWLCDQCKNPQPAQKAEEEEEVELDNEFSSAVLEFSPSLMTTEVRLEMVPLRRASSGTFSAEFFSDENETHPKCFIE